MRTASKLKLLGLGLAAFGAAAFGGLMSGSVEFGPIAQFAPLALIAGFVLFVIGRVGDG